MVCGARFVVCGVCVCVRAYVCVYVYTLECWSTRMVLNPVVFLLKFHPDGVWCAVCSVCCVGWLCGCVGVGVCVCVRVCGGDVCVCVCP